jgi:hypothetical protein
LYIATIEGYHRQTFVYQLGDSAYDGRRAYRPPPFLNVTLPVGNLARGSDGGVR